MYKILKPSLVALAAIAFLTSEASAQYYNPGTVVQNNAFQPGLGLSLGAQNGGLNPNAGSVSYTHLTLPTIYSV